MKLTQQDWDILVGLQLSADSSMVDLGKRIGCREHVIRHAIKKFHDWKLIVRKPFLDLISLGLQEFAFYFSLAPDSRQSESAILKDLREAPCVAWLVEFSGDLPYGVAIYARQASEVMDFLEKLTKRHGNIFFAKAMAMRLSFTMFPFKGFSKKGHAGMLSFDGASGSLTIDETDHLLLRAITRNPEASNSEISRQAGVPNATVSHRIARLKEKGLLKGFFYHVNFPLLGLHGYRQVVSVKGIDEKLRTRFLEFCRSHQRVTLLTTCLGAWDFEIGVLVENAHEMTAISRELYREFGDQIVQIKTLGHLQSYKVSPYPFDRLP